MLPELSHALTVENLPTYLVERQSRPKLAGLASACKDLTPLVSIAVSRLSRRASMRVDYQYGWLQSPNPA
jgi:hypothetical protein